LTERAGIGFTSSRPGFTPPEECPLNASQKPGPLVNARKETLDSVRLVAVFFVIGIHSFPLFLVADQNLVRLGFIFNQICRFAVPSFFVVSGYLFAKNFDHAQPLKRLSRTSKRLATLYLFWCVVYLLPYNVALIPTDGWDAPVKFAHWHFYMWTLSWENFLFGGAKTQLWFLPALLCAAVISTPFIYFRRIGYLLVLGLILFGIALLSSPYRETPIGFDPGFFTRNGPFLSTVFFASGVLMAQENREPRNRLVLGYVLTGVGLAWHLAEALWLKQYYDGPTIYDFNSGTLAFGIGAAMLGIYGAKPLQSRWLVENGKYSLGIYLLHMFVMDLLYPLNRILASNVLWSLVLPVLTIVLTLQLVKFLLRYAPLRKVLS
jgi:surface polysaccharide O-acyltransferase-like enzyme